MMVLQPQNGISRRSTFSPAVLHLNKIDYRFNTISPVILYLIEYDIHYIGIYAFTLAAIFSHANSLSFAAAAVLLF